MQPCGQEGKIAKIEATQEHLVALMDRHEEREERMTDAMEKVSAQTEILKAHAATLDRHERAFDELFAMFRSNAEKEQAKALEKKPFAIMVLESQFGWMVLAVIAVNTLVNIIAHAPIVRAIMGWFR